MDTITIDDCPYCGGKVKMEQTNYAGYTRYKGVPVLGLLKTKTSYRCESCKMELLTMVKNCTPSFKSPQRK